MRRIIALLGLSVVVPLGVIFLYALLHEGGHALLVLLFGGQVAEFQVNFFAHSPHVSYVGIDNPLQKAFISLAGPVFPLILVWPLTMLMRRTKNHLVQATILLLLVNMLPTILLSAVIALIYGFGTLQPTEDVAKFIYYSGFNPFVTSGAFVFLFGAVLVFLLKVGRAKEIVLGVLRALVGPAEKRVAVLLGRVFVVLFLLPVGVGILQNIVAGEPQLSPTLNYQTKIEVDLLAKVQAGTFTAQSYQEEGYSLIYQGIVSQGGDELLATFSGGGRGRRISAFVVGSSDVSLFYEADGKTHTLLDGFQATIGRGLPLHRGQGEIRVKALEGEAILFIYVREE